MDPAHAGCYGVVRAMLENSCRRLEAAPVPAVALPKLKPDGCPHRTSEEIVRLGRLDARGRLHYSYRTADFPSAEACRAEAQRGGGANRRNESGEDAPDTFTRILA